MTVSAADTRPKYVSPHSTVAWAPTPAAPTIFAIVLSVSMEDSGLLISSLNFFSNLAFLLPCASLALTNDRDTEKSTDSVIEQRNETDSAKNRNERRRVNLYLFCCSKANPYYSKKHTISNSISLYFEIESKCGNKKNHKFFKKLL